MRVEKNKKKSSRAVGAPMAAATMVTRNWGLTQAAQNAAITSSRLLERLPADDYTIPYLQK